LSVGGGGVDLLGAVTGTCLSTI